MSNPALGAVSQYAVSAVASLGAAIPEPTYAVEVEFAVGSYTDVTSFCNRFDITRQLSTIYNDLAEGRCTAELYNGDRRFSPGNAGSPYYPNVVPGRNMRVKATHSGTTHFLFTGRLLDYQLSPEMGNQSVTVEAADSVRRLKNVAITTPLFTNTNPSSVFTAVMSQCGVNSFSSDQFQDTIPYAWYQDVQATTAIQDLIRFGKYALYEDGAGTIQLKNRYFGIGLSSVATFAIDAPDGLFGMKYTLSEESVINRAKIESSPRAPTTAQNTVAWITNAITIPASSAVGFWLSYVDPDQTSVLTPATSLQTPVASSDYLVNTSSDGTGTNITSALAVNVTMFGEAAVCSLYNATAATAYVTKFQIRGFSVRDQPSLSAQSDVSSSQSTFGLRSFFLQSNLIGDRNFASDFAASVTAEKNTPRPDLTISRKNDFPAILGIDLANIVSLVDSYTGVNSQWLVKSLRHSVTLANGLEHQFDCEIEFYTEQNFLVLDSASFGQLDSTRVLAF